MPTFKEVGLEPVNRMAFYGILGPKGMQKDVVDKINAAVKEVLQDPAVRKRIADTGSLVIGNSPKSSPSKSRQSTRFTAKWWWSKSSRWNKAVR